MPEVDPKRTFTETADRTNEGDGAKADTVEAVSAKKVVNTVRIVGIACLLVSSVPGYCGVYRGIDDNKRGELVVSVRLWKKIEARRACTQLVARSSVWLSSDPNEHGTIYVLRSTVYSEHPSY